MSLPYFLRLLALCGASYFLIYTITSALVCVGAGQAIRIAQEMRASTSARFLFAVRILPMALTLLIVLVFCIPSYLWLEPGSTAEEVGFVCVLMALLGVLSWGVSVRRVLAVVTETSRYLRDWKQRPHQTQLLGETASMVLLEEEKLVLAVAGVVHPQLVVSQRALACLAPDQMDVAIQHERAHLISRDNLKRLLILLAPNVFPFLHGFARLEQSWAKFTEWAADDYAVAGDSHRALSLASALIVVVKLNSQSRVPALTSCLVADDRGLEARVDRLLNTQLTSCNSLRPMLPFFGGVTAVATGVLGLAVIWPASLSLVHNVLERLVR